MRVLVTGGAGFIGSHTVDALLENGYEVRVLDNLESQVHGPGRKWPTYLDKRVECVLGDVRDRATLAQALSGVNVVFHLATATGAGQSMYQINKYFDVNVQGTANLLDILAHESHQIQKLIVASSRAIYGEGAYCCDRCGVVTPDQHSYIHTDDKQWDALCPHCTSPITPIPTPETKTPKPASMYAITKLTQEQMCLCFAKAYSMPVVVLRYFNVYGPRQSFSDPYTGIITTFLSRLFNGKVPEVYEDGRMTRDFVHVVDVKHANMLALERDGANDQVFNVGTGVGTSIWALAELLCDMVLPGLRPELVGVTRVGDIRHCTAGLWAAKQHLGYQPHVSLQQGLCDVIEDAKQQEMLKDCSAIARRELADLGLLR